MIPSCKSLSISPFTVSCCARGTGYSFTFFCGCSFSSIDILTAVMCPFWGSMAASSCISRWLSLIFSGSSAFMFMSISPIRSSNKSVRLIFGVLFSFSSYILRPPISTCPVSWPFLTRFFLRKSNPRIPVGTVVSTICTFAFQCIPGSCSNSTVILAFPNISTSAPFPTVTMFPFSIGSICRFALFAMS
ncbi:hypothetical protein PAEPH01_2440 [Pancytospora epiphaga]|nr:hypothetical protein PAEPH01_2440 [Pancytospora epiphaga]